MLFLALALVSLLAFGAGALARRLRQPPVVGERHDGDGGAVSCT
jgi:Kef-type K+ transport system membrane component KefB